MVGGDIVEEGGEEQKEAGETRGRRRRGKWRRGTESAGEMTWCKCDDQKVSRYHSV